MVLSPTETGRGWEAHSTDGETVQTRTPVPVSLPPRPALLTDVWLPPVTGRSFLSQVASFILEGYLESPYSS